MREEPSPSLFSIPLVRAKADPLLSAHYLVLSDRREIMGNEESQRKVREYGKGRERRRARVCGGRWRE